MREAVLLLGLAALPACGQMDVLTVLQTRDYAVDVDTVRFVWEVLPDQVFYPDSFGGPAGSVDSAVFTIPFLWFPPAVQVHYRADGGPTRSDTIAGIVQDSWYLLPAGAGNEPLVKFARLHGVAEQPAAGAGVTRAWPNPFRDVVRFSGQTCRTEVRDCAGRLVCPLPAGADCWQGRDRTGRPAARGVYLLSVPGRAAVRLVKL